jgi:CubicO group peptidase (beta-lactamase class C family)
MLAEERFGTIPTIQEIGRLKYLEPVSSFREKPAYQNVMYVVASEIVKTVAGISWDDFLKPECLIN